MPSMVEAKIIKLEIKDNVKIAGSDLHLIYDGATGRRTEYKVPVGVSWELRVTCYGKADAAAWSCAVSVVVTGVPAAYQKQAQPAKALATAYTKDFNFNMGAMPNAPVTIDRVKYWTSDLYDLPSGQGKPPEDQW